MAIQVTKPTKHKLLLTIGPERIERVDSMFRQGESTGYVTRVIQDSWKLLTDVEPDTLKKALSTYRKDRVREAMVETLVEQHLVDPVTRLANKVDPLNELYKLVYIQRGRVGDCLDKEGKTPKENTRKEINVFRQLLIDVANIQIEMGILPRATKSLRTTVGEDGVMTFRMTEEEAGVVDVLLQDEVYALPGR